MNKNVQDREQKFFNELRNSITKDGRQMYVGRIVERAYQLFPDRQVIIFLDRTMTYRELYFRACMLSKKIQEKGIKRGDRVLLFFENSPEFYIAYYAILQAGAVVAPLNTFLRERELYHIVEDAKPSLMISSKKSLSLFDALDPAQRPPIMTEDDMDLELPVPQHMPLFTIISQEPHEMAALMYTSGTTGLPKGVMLSSKNMMSNINQAMPRLELDEHERVLAVLPLFHSFAQITCVLGSLVAGATVILVPKIDRRALLVGLEHKPTVFFGVPALFGLLCLMKTAPINDVRFFVSGGDALPDRIRMAFEMVYRRKLCNGYGLTEASPVVAVDVEDRCGITSTIGRPLIGIQCSLRDEENNEMPHGQVGILWVKGDNVMMGYYNDPEKTAETLKDGWLNTGDFAYVDDEGKLVISGRYKDLIINKGINIYPQEIENIILSHPAVLRVAVIGKPDESVGEVPVAFVQLKDPLENAAEKLHALCQKELAPYKVPKSFTIMEELPITGVGKVNKQMLRKQLTEQL